MKRQINLRHRRSNTEESLNYNKKQKAQPSIEDQSSDNAFSIGSLENPREILYRFQNSQNRLGQRFVTYPNEDEAQEGSIPSRVKQLMKGLKELIQELCLTKNATQEIEEELQKIIASFSQAIVLTKNRPLTSQNHYLSGFENRNQTFSEKGHNFTQSQIPWTSFFSTYLQGTVYQDEQKENKEKISSYQEELLGQFMDRFFSLLQKQINRITKYNGEKKLKFLLETVMKQVFVYLMRFSYDTRIEIFKKEKRNYLNNPVNKMKVFVSTIERIMNLKKFTATAFTSIRSMIKVQKDNDMILVNKFEGRINFLDNLIQIRERKELREKFLEWRKNSVLHKHMQKHGLFSNVSLLIKEMIYDFALHESEMEKWKVDVWTKLNNLMRKICKFGEVIVFPVDDELLYQAENNKSGLTSVALSRFKSQRQTESFRYSPSVVESQEEYENQQKILDEINDLFSTEEIRICMKSGEIIMNQNYEAKFILIPVKAVSGIIAIQTPLEGSTLNFGDLKSKMNANTFYTILNALELLSPALLEILQLREKFEYFLQRIKSKSHHKFVLKSILEPESFQIESKEEEIAKSGKNTKRNGAFSELLSFTNRSYPEEERINGKLRKSENILIDCVLEKLKAKSLIVYHRKQEKGFQTCIEFPEESQNSQEKMGSEIAEAIASELERLNRNFSSQEMRCLELRRNGTKFYVCPLIRSRKLRGFVKISLVSQNKEEGLKFKGNKESAFVVKSVDEKNQNFNEGIEFLVTVIIPMLITQKANGCKDFGNANGLQIKTLCSNCQIYSRNIQRRNKQFHIEMDQQPNFLFSSQEELKFEQLNNFFIQYSSEKSELKKQLFIEKTFVKFAQKQLINLNETNNNPQISRTNQIGSKILIAADSIETLVERQVFARIFFLQNPKTKDNKVFLADNKVKKQSQKVSTSHTYFCLDWQKVSNAQIKTNETKESRIYVNMDFIDSLQFFRENEKPQTLEVSIAHLIQVYKKIVKAENKDLKVAQTHIKFSQTNLNSHTEINSIDILLEQVLKSIHTENDLVKKVHQPSSIDQKYHSLELLLYQLEHLSKNFDKKKLKFLLIFTPIFALLDDKNKYLTGLSCQGSFILKNSNQSIDFNFNSQTESSKMFLLSQSIQYFNKKILSKFLWLHKKLSLLPKATDPQKNKNSEKFQSLQSLIFLELKPMSSIEFQQNVLFKRQKNQLNKVLSAILELKSLITQKRNKSIKECVFPKFKSNLKFQSFKILSQMQNCIQSKIIDRRFTTKEKLFKNFWSNLRLFLQSKEQKYCINCHQMQKTLNKVFVRNKIFKRVFDRIKNIQKSGQNQFQGDLNSLSFVKDFAVQRMLKTIKRNLFKDNEKLQKSFCRQAFDQIRQFTLDSKYLASLEKKKSIFAISDCLKKLICTKAYLPYFQHLQYLENSLTESISLIGTQVQAIDFYSIYQFLRFVYERVSIILKSEKKLISVLYGNSIQKLHLEIIVQNKKDKSFFKLSLSEKSYQKLHHSENQPSIFNENPQKIHDKISNLIEIFENQSRKLYFSFNFTDDQEKTEIKQAKLESLKQIVRKVFEHDVVAAFNRFYTLYEKKIKGFTLKLSKVLKIKTHFSERNHDSESIVDEEKIFYKKLAFKKLQSQIVKTNQMQRVQQISNEAQRKHKELVQLLSHYQNRAKKLSSQEIKDIEQNDENSGEKIITKGMIKSLKQKIEVLDQNSENLSIQYQIKSKTVASYQIIESINLKQRKQALRQVTLNISGNQNYHDQNINQAIYDEKQKLKSLKCDFEDLKNDKESKLKKAGTRSIAKVLGNLNKSAFKKVFYRINSFSSLSAFKLVR